MTAFYTAQQAIISRLATQWAAIPRTEPIFLENEDRSEAVSTTTGFLVAEVIFSDATQISIGAGNGANLFRHTGTIFVHIVCPAGAGAKEALDRADLVAGIFRNQQFGGVTCRAPSIGKSRPDAVEGNWFMVTVSCGFYYDANF